MIEYPDELTPLIVNAYWTLYGDGRDVTDEEKRAHCHGIIKRGISAEVAKYVREQAMSKAAVVAEQQAEIVKQQAEREVKIVVES